MDLNECINELYLAHQRQWSLEKQIREHLIKYVEEHRIHQDGDVVEVYDEMGKYLGDGIVTSASTCVFIMDTRTMKKYLENPDSLTKDSERIRYEVFAKTKQGFVSLHHFMGSQHYFMDIKDITKKGNDRYIIAKNK